MLRRLLLPIAAACIAIPAYAQTPAPEPPAKIDAAAQDDPWPNSVLGGEVLIVKLSEPHKRQHCSITSFAFDSVSCKRPRGQAAQVFPRAEIAALILPAYHSHQALWYLGDAGLEAAIVYAALLLNPISAGGAIALIVVGSLYTFFSVPYIAFMLGDDGGNQPERLLYLQPGTHLSVKLRN